MWSFNFDEDPFFRGHRERIGGFGGRAQLEERGGAGNDSVSRRGDDFGFGQLLDPGMGGMLGQMQRMMEDMGSGMRMEMQGGNAGAPGHSYMQSSVYSYSKDKDGRPEIYEAHHSNRHAPGGVREERKALRDTRRELEKMAIGRHIGQRGHVLEKSRNTRSNDITQHQNLIGLGEEEVDAYHQEWNEKTRDWRDRNNRRNQLQDEMSFDHFRRRGLERPPARHSEGPQARQAALEYHPDEAETKPRRSKHVKHSSKY